MAEYIEREAVCYQLAKQAMIDGQSRAIKRAMRIVQEFPSSVIHCRDCGHWNYKNQQISKRGGGNIAMCAWWSRYYDIIQTSEGDYCSYGYGRQEDERTD